MLVSGHGRWAWLQWPTNAICEVRGPCLQPSLSLSDWLRLVRVAQVPRCRDLTVFVVTTDGQKNHRYYAGY